jgi:hypothetical protein
MMRAGLGWLRILADLVHFLYLGSRSRTSLAAENLFLRKQLAFYQERKVKPVATENSMARKTGVDEGAWRAPAKPTDHWREGRAQPISCYWPLSSEGIGVSDAYHRHAD